MYTDTIVPNMLKCFTSEKYMSEQASGKPPLTIAAASNSKSWDSQV